MRSPDGVLFNLPPTRYGNNANTTVKTPISNAPPIDEQISRWLKATAHSPRSQEKYGDSIIQYRKLLHENGLDLDCEDETRILPLAQNWAASSITGIVVASSTYNNRLYILRSFYTFARKYRWMKSNPLETAEIRERVYSNVAQPLDLVEVEKALKSIDREALQGKRDYALLCILLMTGRTVSEVVALRCGDIAIGESEVTITFQHCKGGRVAKHPFPIASRTAQALIEYLNAIYHGTWHDDNPVWISNSKQNRKRKVPIKIQAIANICKMYLGTSKVTATRYTFFAMQEGAGTKEMERLLDLK
jgi:site-specific recombinase XerD